MDKKFEKKVAQMQADIARKLKEAERHLKKKKPKKDFVRFPARDEFGRVISRSRPRTVKKKTGSHIAHQNQTVSHVAEMNVRLECEVYQTEFKEEFIEDSYVVEFQKKIKDLLGKLDEKSGRTWAKRRENETAQWATSRQELFHYVVESHNSLSSKCFYCGQGDGHLKCTQCGGAPLCISCDQRLHGWNALHDRMSRCGYHWVYLQPLEGLQYNDAIQSIESCSVERYFPLFSNCGTCGSNLFDVVTHCECVVITVSGRYDVHLPKSICRMCKDVVTPTIKAIISKGFWPGSPKVFDGMYIFSQELLNMFDVLKLEKPGLSVSSFVSSLEIISTSRRRSATISQKVFSSAFREWRRCFREVEALQMSDFFECPACYDGIHACHLDGNRKVYRYNNRAQSTEENYFKNSFIIDDEKVDSVIQKIKATNVQEKDHMCGESHWKAAKSRSKTMKNLSETGLEVACCRHSVMLQSLNMFQGEIYAYPMVLQLSLLEKFNSIRFICQDVICKYFPWMNRILQSLQDIPAVNSLLDCQPFLSVMHGKAHSWSCQIIWGGRWQKGSGFMSGEEMEQCNAYLSTTGLTTKTMGKTAREEELTMHAMHWNKRKRDNLPIQLAKWYYKVTKNIQITEDELNLLLINETPHQISVETVELWETQLKNLAVESKSKKDDLSTSIEEQYFLLYTALQGGHNAVRYLEENDDATAIITGTENFHKVAKEMTQKKKENEFETLKSSLSDANEEDILRKGKQMLIKKKIIKQRANIELSFSAVKQYEHEIKHIADKSKMRHRVRLKMSKEKLYLKKLVEDYNILAATSVPVVTSINDSELEEGNWPWTSLQDEFIPTKTKRKIVEKKLTLDRLKEEKVLLVKDMNKVLEYHQTKQQQLNRKIGEFESSLKMENNVDFDAVVNGTFPKMSSPGKYHFGFVTKEVFMGCLGIMEKAYHVNDQKLAHCLAVFRDTLKDNDQLYDMITANENERVEETIELEELSEDDSDSDIAEFL